MRGPEGGVLLVSADSWQRLFRNHVRRPQDGTFSEAQLISGKDTPGTSVRSSNCWSGLDSGGDKDTYQPLGTVARASTSALRVWL